MITVDVPVEVMNLDVLPPSAFQITPLGLEITGELSFDEWKQIGRNFGTSLKSAAFCIGDWLVYGENKWGKQLALEGMDAPRGRISREDYEAAMALTGLDVSTLGTYASVCRKMGKPERYERLSFDHHKALAPMPPAARDAWAKLVVPQESGPLVSVRRLRASIRRSKESPRILEAAEIEAPSTGGHDNHIPHLMRLTTVLRKTFPDMDDEQRKALREDFAPLFAILAGTNEE